MYFILASNNSYIYAACVCLCFVDCWRLEHWCAAFEDIFRFRWFLSRAVIPFSCSLTENLSSDLLFKLFFFRLHPSFTFAVVASHPDVVL